MRCGFGWNIDRSWPVHFIRPSTLVHFMASASGPGTSWEAPKKNRPPQATNPASQPPPEIDTKRRKLYYTISFALIVIGLIIVGLFVVPFIRGFINMSYNFMDEALRMRYLRDAVNNGVSSLIGALIAYGGYKLFHAAWHPKPDNFPLKPSTPGQVLKPGE